MPVSSSSLHEPFDNRQLLSADRRGTQNREESPKIHLIHLIGLRISLPLETQQSITSQSLQSGRTGSFRLGVSWVGPRILIGPN